MRLARLATAGHHHVATHLRYVAIRKTVAQADIHHIRIRRFQGKQTIPQVAADAVEGGGGWHEDGQGFHLHRGAITVLTHVADQGDGFACTQMLVDVRIFVAHEHAIQRIRHALREIGVQIKRRGNRHPVTDKPTDSFGKVRLEIVDTLRHTGTVQVQEHTVHRHCRRQAVQEPRFQRLIGLAVDDAGRLRVRPEHRHRLPAL